VDSQGLVGYWSELIRNPDAAIAKMAKSNGGYLEAGVLLLMGAAACAAITWMIDLGASALKLSEFDMGVEIFGSIILLLFIIPYNLVISIFMHLVAKALGGTGSFRNFFYVVATIEMPMTMLRSLTSVPGGNFLTIGIAIIDIGLLQKAVSSTHGLEGGKAWASVLIPTITLIVAAVLLVATSILLMN